MLSYLHAYHAGNRADVHKHRALARLLVHLTAKPRPITYMETHAGRGLYDLASAEAQKTGEAEAGIVRALAEGALPDDDPYRRAVEAAKAQYGAPFYPGSPWIAQFLLREGDALHLMERHPKEHPALKRAVRGANVHVHFRDGYEGVLALSPPTPRGGLVLIDPSFEVKSEYAEAADFILTLHRKWPEAAILLWYPILAEARHLPMIAALEQGALPKATRHEDRFPDTAGERGMQGSGLFLVNTPWGYDLG